MKKAVLKQFRDIYHYFREHGLRATLFWFHGKDAPGIIQFLKYGLAGGIATVASMGTWLVLCLTIYPAISAEEMQKYRDLVGFVGLELPTFEVESMVLDRDLRAANSLWANIWGWIAGNNVAYLVNVLWVFQGGRHNRWLEYFYFTLISAIATLAGLAMGPLLIKIFGIPTGLSQVSLLITAVLVNYVCRKFFVFAK